MEGIRNGGQVTIKKLSSSLQGSGSTPDKHQVQMNYEYEHSLVYPGLITLITVVTP